MDIIQFQCSRCGSAIKMEFRFLEPALVSQVSMVIRCPKCRQSIWLLAVPGMSEPFIVPLDDTEMKGSLLNRLIHMVAALEQQIRPQPTTISEDNPGAGGSGTNVPVTTMAGKSTEPDPSLDFHENDDSAHRADFDCPKCGARYALIVDEPPPEHLRIPVIIECRRCHHPMPQSWYRRGKTNRYCPEPVPSISADQRAALPPIDRIELATFAAMLEGGVGDTKEIEET